MKPINYKRTRIIFFGLGIILITLILSFLAMIPPTPTNDQILQAITKSNEGEDKPLDFDYEEMVVPIRYPGKAGVVLYVRDNNMQRNFWVLYDKERKNFYAVIDTTMNEEDE